MTLTIARRSAPTALATILGALAILLPPHGAAAQTTGDVTSTSTMSDGTGGPSTLTPSASLQTPSDEAFAANAQTTVDLSTGAALSTFAFQLEKARGGAQPSLALTYNSSAPAAVGFAGAGWTLQLPSIVRRGAAGMPLFTDDVFTASPATLASTSATFDSYVVDGQLLVPICAVGACTATQLVSGEVLPSSLAGTSLTGWMYFRREVDDGARYFFAPGGQTWIRQEHSGLVTQYGHPLDSAQVDPSLSDGIERPAPTTNFMSTVEAASAVYRWYVVRQSDAVGNTVYYTWTSNVGLAPGATVPGLQYLSDIYDTLAIGQSPSPVSFAHHVHLNWELDFPLEPTWPVYATIPSMPPPTSAPGTITSPPTLDLESPIWRAVPFAQLANVDVTSASWSSPSRSLVRRYDLAYQPNSWLTANRLTTITVEGECQSGSTLSPVPEGPTGLVPNPTGCASAASTLVLAQYTYYPDSLGTYAGLPVLAPTSTAFPLDPTYTNYTTIAGPETQIVDVNGDGAADLVYGNVVPGGPIYVQPFSGTVSTLADPTGGALNPTWTITLASSDPFYLGLPEIQHPLLSGDWLANGAVNWITETSLGAWGVYTVSGNAFVDPLTTFGVGLCAQPGVCDTGRSLDVDGDGLIDQTIAPVQANAATFLTQRAHDGSISPFAVSPPPYAGWAYGIDPGQLQRVSRAMADMDGDGLADIVTEVPYSFQYEGWVNLQVWFNHGDGIFGPNPTSWWSPEIVGPASFVNTMSVHADLNGDGLADVVSVWPDGSEMLVCLRYGALFSASTWACATIQFPACGGTQQDNAPIPGYVLDVADIDGTGVPRILWRRAVTSDAYDPQYATNCVDSAISETAVVPGTSPSLGAPPVGTYPGLLQSVTLLGGAQQTLTYQPVRSLPNVGAAVPTSAWVVTSVQSTNGIPATSLMSRTSTTSYTYQSPVYDPRDKQLVGFGSTQESHSGDVGAPGLVRTTTFATLACGASTGTPCTGQVDYGWFRALRGLPLVVSDADTTGANVGTTVNRYDEHHLYTGLDGRLVRSLPKSVQTQYAWSGGGAPKVVHDVLFASLSATSPYEVYSQSNTVSMTLPGVTATHKQHWTQNDLGDQRTTIDFGEPGVDTPIRTEMTWTLPAGDTTGWSYRLHTQKMGYTTTSAGTTLQTPPARSSTYTYTALGQLLKQTADLPNEPALFELEANAPTDATSTTTVCVVGCTSKGVSGIQYDAVGNATMTPGPNDRCSATTYDPLFGQLPASSLAFQNGCNSTSPAPMQTTTIYDRGLEQVTQKTAPFAGVVPQVTMMRYDPFGRVLEVDQPSATLAGTTDPSPALLVFYDDSAPVRQVTSWTVDGTSPSWPVGYQDHVRFVDGYGDTLGVLDQQTDNNFVVSGARIRYQNGLVQQAYVPFFASPNALDGNYNWNASAPPVASSSTYDGAGRALSATDPDGYTTTYSYQFGLSNAASAVTKMDPEQTSGGHVGSFTTSYSDGHGRTIVTDSHVAQSALGAGDLITTTSYTAAGERTAISQTYPGGTYQRQMTWDTLGRMVAQTEPNTGTWQYAYDDNNELVATMDARGCGEVIYHDHLGRETAEDYSPCEGADAPRYTVPDLKTGDGTEVFFKYDGYGNVAAEYDRAHSSTFNYDARNRLTQEQRQLATLALESAISGRYAPQVYTRQVLSYSEANRPLVYTTGAEQPALLDASGQSQVTVQYQLTGQVVTVSGSYGSLLDYQQTDAAGRVTQQVFGDVAQTTSSMTYDNDERLVFYTLGRPSGPWTSYAQGGFAPQPTDYTTQGWLAFGTMTYDMVGNPVTVNQANVNPAEWPQGALPISARTMTYWDDYRLATVSTTYMGPGGTDSAGISGNPYTQQELSEDLYPDPAPVSTGNRTQSQTFGYDLRGNVQTSTDDANDLWDRSLGVVTYAPGTDQAMTSTGGGTMQYDASGNMTGATTATGMTLQLGFDELGRLVYAARTGPTGETGGGGVNEQYLYDGRGERVVTRTAAGPDVPTYVVNVFDSFVLKNASFPDSNGDYAHNELTEQVYVNAGGATYGHVFVGKNPVGAALDVFLPLRDPLGSTSFVVEQSSSELVEAMSYLPYGGIDSDWRPSRWRQPREDERWTGQWDNAEVGLVYMHARYYSPELGRFVSPDPMTIHGTKGDLNPYAYAFGSPLRFADPTGLAPQSVCDEDGCASWDDDDSQSGPGTLNVGEMTIHAPSPLEVRQTSVLSSVAQQADLPPYTTYFQGEWGAQPSWSLGEYQLQAFGYKGTLNDEHREIFTLGLGYVGLAASGVGDVELSAGAGLLRSLGGEGTTFAEGACAGGMCPCFVAGTAVDTDDGAKPIEAVALGDRVGPELPECTAPELAHWREVDLLMTVENDGVPDELEIHLLRPDAWIREHRALEGHVVAVTLDDLNVAGHARVTRLGTAGHVTSGTRCPATGWVRHTSHDVIALALDGEETLNVTRHHRLFSAVRQDWVRAGDLKAGETLKTKTGVVRVTSVGVESLPRLEVFNLEVFGAHRYFVGEHQVLAHNVYGAAFEASLERSVIEEMSERAGGETAEAWELQQVSGPHKIANPDPNLGPDQVRLQAQFWDTFNEETVDISVNYDPTTNQFGIIKFASGQ